MRRFQVAVFPGDGIGPEVMAPCLSLLKTLIQKIGGFDLAFESFDAGATRFSRTGIALPDQAMDAAAKADAILLGAMGIPNVRYPDGTEVQPHLDMREKFQLYAGIRPFHIMRGAPTPLKDPRAAEVDCVLVRESTEGLFASRSLTRREGDAVYDTMKISRSVSERLFDAAFKLAIRRAQADGRRSPRVTCVDKANVLPSMAYFRSIFLEIAGRYPDVQSDCAYVDATALKLVRTPWEFDVLVTENMFGDILSDVGAALVGGMGMAPSADIGDHHAIFQPCHGTAPDITGQGLANPTAMLLSAAMMLDWLGDRHDNQPCRHAAATLTQAVETAFARGDLVSTENGGKAGTDAIASRVSAALAEQETRQVHA